MSETHLNAAQVSQIEKRIEAQLEGVIARLQLRKWSVEQAIAVCASLNSVSSEVVKAGDKSLVVHDPMALARAVYDFVAATDKPVKIELTA